MVSLELFECRDLETIVRTLGEPIERVTGKKRWWERKEKEFCVFYDDINTGGFSFPAYCVADNHVQYAGSYTVACLKEEDYLNPRQFLELPDGNPQRPVYRTDVFIYPRYRKRGLAAALWSLVIDELKVRGAQHVVYFTRKGKRYLKHKYLAKGYQLLETKQDISLPKWAQHYDELFYFDYST